MCFPQVDFTNPAVLGTAEDFRRYYQNPILTGREPDASPQEKDLALVRQNEMSLLVNQFILRRMNTINAQHLPDKLVQVSVSCRRWHHLDQHSRICNGPASLNLIR